MKDSKNNSKMVNVVENTEGIEIMGFFMNKDLLKMENCMGVIAYIKMMVVLRLKAYMNMENY